MPLQEKLSLLQSNAGIDVAINGERPRDDGGVERDVWYARTMEAFNEEGKGLVRFYREVKEIDDVLFHFCPDEKRIEAEEIMPRFPNKRWFTFYEAGRYVIAEREMNVSVSEVIILEPEYTETKLIWAETRRCVGMRETNELVMCSVSCGEEARIQSLFCSE